MSSGDGRAQNSDSRSESHVYSVLHVCKVFLPIRGGVQIVASRIRSSVRDRFNNHVLASTTHKTSTRKDANGEVTLVRSYGELFSMPVAPRLIFEIWRKSRQCDLLVVHYPFPLADLAIALAHFCRLPPVLVYWHSEIISQKVSSLLVRPFTRAMLKRAEAIVVSSPNLIEHSTILQKYQSKCRVIPFGYLPQSSTAMVSDNDYFLFIGRHVPYKGIEVLIRAIAISRVKVKIAGSGPLFNRHRNLVDQLGISNFVEFSETSSDDEIEKLISECKALVLPSILPSEAFALVQIEAMSFGKPVINTNLPSGVPWVARHQKEGLTVEPGDINGLASALTLLQGDINLLHTLGVGAKKRWEQQFSMKVFARDTRKLYLELVERSGH